MPVYFALSADESAVKIGHSKSPKKRISTLQCGNSRKLSLYSTRSGGKDMEDSLHKAFAHQRIRGEWFRWTPEIEAVANGGDVPDSVPFPNPFQSKEDCWDSLNAWHPRIGTGYGERVSMPIRQVPFDREDKPCEECTIYYEAKERLEYQGLPREKVEALLKVPEEEQPNAFPAGDCPAPPNWRG